MSVTTVTLSPLLLRIATRPLAEHGALRLLRFGEIASGRQRVPATTTALSGSRVAVEPFRARTSASQTRSVTASRVLRLDDEDGAVTPLQEGSDSEDDMPPLMTTRLLQPPIFT
ncbi:hypothetical protein B0H14DRAFT_3451667 [Mycena olivaceomarginata]|nr:hypothetical protein B0H14DRAFT_3451667 [Mycena olivaceomarginata]